MSVRVQSEVRTKETAETREKLQVSFGLLLVTCKALLLLGFATVTVFPVHSELLQDLDQCDNNPVAIARCFVIKVRPDLIGFGWGWFVQAAADKTLGLLYFRASTLTSTHSTAPTIQSKPYSSCTAFPYVRFRARFKNLVSFTLTCPHLSVSSLLLQFGSGADGVHEEQISCQIFPGPPVLA